MDEFLEKLQEDQRRMRRFLRAHGPRFKQMGEALGAARTLRSRVFVLGEPPLDALAALVAEDYLTHLPSLPVDLSRPSRPSIDPEDGEPATGRAAAAKQAARHLHAGDVVLALLVDGEDKETRKVLEAAKQKRVTTLVIGGMAAKGPVRRLATVRLNLPTQGVKTIVESCFVVARILARISRGAWRAGLAAEEGDEEQHLILASCDTCGERVFAEESQRGKDMTCPLCQGTTRVPKDAVRRLSSVATAPPPAAEPPPKKRRLKPSVMNLPVPRADDDSEPPARPSPPDDELDIDIDGDDDELDLDDVDGDDTAPIVRPRAARREKPPEPPEEDDDLEGIDLDDLEDEDEPAPAPAPARPPARPASRHAVTEDDDARRKDEPPPSGSTRRPEKGLGGGDASAASEPPRPRSKGSRALEEEPPSRSTPRPRAGDDDPPTRTGSRHRTGSRAQTTDDEPARKTRAPSRVADDEPKTKSAPPPAAEPMGLVSHDAQGRPSGRAEPSFGSDILVGSDVVHADPPPKKASHVAATTASADPFALEEAYLADLEAPRGSTSSTSSNDASDPSRRLVSARFTVAECRVRWGRGGYPDDGSPPHELISLTSQRLEFFLDPDDEAGSTLQKGDELWLRLEIPAFIEPVMARGILLGISGTSGGGRRGARVEVDFQDVDAAVRRKLARAAESMGAPA